MTPDIDDELPVTDTRDDAPGAEVFRPEADAAAALQAEVEELRQKALYAAAETQNVRRRLEKEKADAAAYAATGFARDMLSVADNLGRALDAIPDAVRGDEALKPVVTGLDATRRELDAVLVRHGITRIAAIGEKLDPHRHQAMVELPHDTAAPGTIIQEMQAGYMMKDRLLRPALVGVAKG